MAGPDTVLAFIPCAVAGLGMLEIRFAAAIFEKFAVMRRVCISGDLVTGEVSGAATERGKLGFDTI